MMSTCARFLPSRGVSSAAERLDSGASLDDNRFLAGDSEIEEPMINSVGSNS
jgi:hypothetical protein